MRYETDADRLNLLREAEGLEDAETREVQRVWRDLQAVTSEDVSAHECVIPADGAVSIPAEHEAWRRTGDPCILCGRRAFDREAAQEYAARLLNGAGYF